MRFVTPSFVFALAIALLDPVGAWGAANHCVRAGATGANDGSSWADAWTDLPGTFTRGDTYYVAAGAYGPHAFIAIPLCMVTASGRPFTTSFSVAGMSLSPSGSPSW